MAGQFCETGTMRPAELCALRDVTGELDVSRQKARQRARARMIAHQVTGITAGQAERRKGERGGGVEDGERRSFMRAIISIQWRLSNAARGFFSPSRSSQPPSPFPSSPSPAHPPARCSSSLPSSFFSFLFFFPFFLPFLPFRCHAGQPLQFASLPVRHPLPRGCPFLVREETLIITRQPLPRGKSPGRRYLN